MNSIHFLETRENTFCLHNILAVCIVPGFDMVTINTTSNNMLNKSCVPLNPGIYGGICIICVGHTLMIILLPMLVKLST